MAQAWLRCWIKLGNIHRKLLPKTTCLRVMLWFVRVWINWESIWIKSWDLRVAMEIWSRTLSLTILLVTARVKTIRITAISILCRRITNKEAWGNKGLLQSEDLCPWTAPWSNMVKMNKWRPKDGTSKKVWTIQQKAELTLKPTNYGVTRPPLLEKISKWTAPKHLVSTNTRINRTARASRFQNWISISSTVQLNIKMTTSKLEVEAPKKRQNRLFLNLETALPPWWPMKTAR